MKSDRITDWQIREGTEGRKILLGAVGRRARNLLRLCSILAASIDLDRTETANERSHSFPRFFPYSQWEGRENPFEREREIDPDIYLWDKCVVACEGSNSLKFDHLRFLPVRAGVPPLQVQSKIFHVFRLCEHRQ